MRIAMFTVLVVSTTAFSSTYPFPLLQKTLGGMDKKDGVLVTKTCQVFDDQPGLDLKETLSLIAEAEKAPVSRFLHVQRQVPSIEVWAHYPTRVPVGPAATGLGSRKVLLLEDSSSGKVRTGKAAERLMELVEKSCRDL